MKTDTHASATNMVAHYCDIAANRDKVYIACIREVDGTWEVIGKWGSRGARLNEQRKSVWPGPALARQAAESLFKSKIRRGYVDITSPTYNGPVTIESVRKYLEKDTDVEGNGPALAANGKPAKKPGRKKKIVIEEFVVRCDDNTGMKELFDQGETYIAKTNEEEEEMIDVRDIYGAWQTCRKTRFERVEE